MNYQDSSSDDIPYLRPEQYAIYEQQLNAANRLSQASLSQPEQRRGRSHFSEDEIRELDAPSPAALPVHGHENNTTPPTTNTIPKPPSLPNVFKSSNHQAPTNNSRRTTSEYDNESMSSAFDNQSRRRYTISWGRRLIGLILIAIPAVLFSAAAHFVDWSMSDFQLFSASFFIFQGVFWPSFGILLTDLFCTSKKSNAKPDPSKVVHLSRGIRNSEQIDKSGMSKWVTFILTLIHSNLTSVALILQLLSIQKLNISISLALSFGFDVVVVLIRYILETRKCSIELIILSVISYVGYGAAAIPAFIASNENTRSDTAVGVGASVGVMLLGIPSSLLLTKLRQERVTEPMLGTSFAFFGCLNSLITKEITFSVFALRLDARAVGWVAGLISVVFLGTIFLFLETKLSSLIWQRDDDDRPRYFSSITRTRIAVFFFSCLWELSRQGFRETAPEFFDGLGGFLVMLSFLLSSGYQAWYKSCQNGHDTTDSASTEASNTAKSNNFCAFIPWLFTQKSYLVKK